jgi:hemoglobin
MRNIRPIFLVGCSITLLLALCSGCAVERGPDGDYFTSGSREADQRAEQRVAQVEQVREPDQQTERQPGEPTTDEDVQTLFERLGGEEGIRIIVDDFVDRALADPRVNWDRSGVRRGGFWQRGRPVAWNPTPDKIAQIKTHMAQFIAVATGGPPRYDGQDMRAAHENLRITNAEFDAAVGAFKATLDRLQIAAPEQKELIAVIESTRPQVVEIR